MVYLFISIIQQAIVSLRKAEMSQKEQVLPWTTPLSP